MTIDQLPTYPQCVKAVNDGLPTKLEYFIFAYSPVMDDQYDDFRFDLLETINECNKIYDNLNP